MTDGREYLSITFAMDVYRKGTGHAELFEMCHKCGAIHAKGFLKDDLCRYCYQLEYEGV